MTRPTPTVVVAMLAVMAASCAPSPPPGLPADTAVVTASAFFLRQSFGSAEPSFGGFLEPSALVARIEFPDLAFAMATTADTITIPIAPRRDREWTPTGRRVRRCAWRASAMSCAQSLRGTVYEGSAGMVVQVTDTSPLTLLRAQRPNWLTLRSLIPGANHILDTLPIRYRE
ncbi:MAG: hypothetical protein ABIP66_02450 [Gemmatimonadaceae bacterium]